MTVSSAPCVRAANPAEAERLSALAWRAKAHWGYPAAQLVRWRRDLTVTPGAIREGHTFVAEEKGGDIAGFYQLDVAISPPELLHLWVDPACMGRGIGRALIAHALARLAALGFAELAIDSDPHAAGFYESLGARRIGTVPAPIDADPARVRPQLRLAARAC